MYPHDDGYEISTRDRVYGQATDSGEGRRSIAVVLFAVSIFILIVSLSCRQATERGTATNVLEAGIATLTDIDQFIADEGPAIRRFALESEVDVLAIPDYPVDVQFTREEIAGSSDEELRTLLLQRSASAVYDDGIGSFDRTGDQSLRRFSIHGVLEFGVGQVSPANHTRATLFALIGLVGCAFFGAISSATARGWGRMRILGLAAAASAIPAIVLFFLLRLMVRAIGGDDPFIEAYGEIADSVLGVPMRNSLIVLAAGVAVIAASIVLERLERMVSRREPLAAGEDDW